MKTQGTRFLDPDLETSQLHWLIVPAHRCPDRTAEDRFVRRFFRKPHEAWYPDRAFVTPVAVQRSRRRVLFQQVSGIELA